MLKCLWYRPTRMHGDVCTTHLLRHWSRFAPSHAPHIAYAASGHQHHGLSSGRAAFAFLPKFCSQSASDLDCWEPQVRSGDIKAVVSHPIRLIVSQAWCAGALSCWKIKNSPEISCACPGGAIGSVAVRAASIRWPTSLGSRLAGSFVSGYSGVCFEIKFSGRHRGTDGVLFKRWPLANTGLL